MHWHLPRLAAGARLSMDDFDQPSRSALIMAPAVGIALLVSLATVNVLIDPYVIFDMPRIAGLNARKPAVRTQQPLMKAEEVVREKPRTVLLGSSRVDIGLDATYTAWSPEFRPVYNLALPGGSPYTALRYLQHVVAEKPPAVVMLGLDFEYFLSKDLLAARWQLPDSEEARLAVDDDGRLNEKRRWRRARDLFNGAVSFDALMDSASTLYANVTGESHDIASGSWLTNAKHMWGAPVPSAYFIAMNLLALGAKGSAEDARVVDDVKAILDLCSQHGIRAVLFINPVHADDLETIDLLGYWTLFEDWKRQMLALAGDGSERNPYAAVQIWDFTGYGRYTTEPVCEGACELTWFWDSFHYTPALGNLVIRALNGVDSEGFGTLLKPENIEAHLLSIREQQRAYRENNPGASKRVLGLQTLISQPGRAVRSRIH